MVRGDAGFTPDAVAFYQFIPRVAFQAGDEKDAVFTKFGKPSVAVIALVEGHDGTLGQAKPSGSGKIMLFCFGDIDKGRNLAMMVEHGVDFHPSRPASVFCPWEKGQAEFDNGGIHAVQLEFESKFVLGRYRHTTAVHFGEQVLKIAHGPGSIGIGHCGSGDRLQAEMKQTFSRRSQAAHTTTQRPPRRQMDEGHDEKMLLEAEFPWSASI